MFNKVPARPENLSTKPNARRLVKSSLSYFAATALIAISGLMPFQHARAQSASDEASEERFSLTLKNADIHSLIETVSLQTGINFIIDPRVKATVNIITSEPVTKDKLYELFLSVLEVHGYATVTSGEFTKIVPTAIGVQSAVPVIGTMADPADKLISEVIRLRNVPAVQLIESLRPLLPQTATIGATASSNSIVITDRAANIVRLRRIIYQLDR